TVWSREPGGETPCRRLPELVSFEVIARADNRQEIQRLGVRRAVEKCKRIGGKKRQAGSCRIVMNITAGEAEQVNHCPEERGKGYENSYPEHMTRGEEGAVAH